MAPGGGGFQNGSQRKKIVLGQPARRRKDLSDGDGFWEGRNSQLSYPQLGLVQYNLTWDASGVGVPSNISNASPCYE